MWKRKLGGGKMAFSLRKTDQPRLSGQHYQPLAYSITTNFVIDLKSSIIHSHWVFREIRGWKLRRRTALFLPKSTLSGLKITNCVSKCPQLSQSYLTQIAFPSAFPLSFASCNNYHIRWWCCVSSLREVEAVGSNVEKILKIVFPFPSSLHFNNKTTFPRREIEKFLRENRQRCSHRFVFSFQLGKSQVASVSYFVWMIILGKVVEAFSSFPLV